MWTLGFPQSWNISGFCSLQAGVISSHPSMWNAVKDNYPHTKLIFFSNFKLLQSMIITYKEDHELSMIRQQKWRQRGGIIEDLKEAFWWMQCPCLSGSQRIEKIPRLWRAMEHTPKRQPVSGCREKLKSGFWCVVINSSSNINCSISTTFIFCNLGIGK